VSDSRERLFLFVQFELPGELGPPDGRYLLRSELDGEPERVIVLKTLGGGRAAEGVRVIGGVGPLARRARSRRREAPPLPQPPRVPVARATIVDPVPVSAEHQAQAWLAGLDAEREAASALAALNRLLYSHRLAAADPYVHEVSSTHPLAIRAGWGEGEQVADGAWLFAQELPVDALKATDGPGQRDSPEREDSPGQRNSPKRRDSPGPGEGPKRGDSPEPGEGPKRGDSPGPGGGPKRGDSPERGDGPGRESGSGGRARWRTPRGRVAALRPDEHLAQLLGARERPLLCEELALRARLDLDRGRIALAAIDLHSALEAAVGELAGEGRVDLSARVSELRDQQPHIERAAQAALYRGGPRDPESPVAPTNPIASAGLGSPVEGSRRDDPALAQEPIRHALERLEAALRARGAAGYDATRDG